MSGDPEQGYFADGIVEDIITGLSRIKWLFVIARILAAGQFSHIVGRRLAHDGF